MKKEPTPVCVGKVCDTGIVGEVLPHLREQPGTMDRLQFQRGRFV